MAAPLVDPLLHRLQQTKSTAGRAAAILRTAFPDHDAIARSDKNVAVQLPRRTVPTYVLPNQHVQPWELLPMKAAAMAQYPNFFNNSCMFFGSLKRDVVNGLPFCLVRPTRLAIDLAKLVRNLGVVEGFEVVQKRHRLGPHDFVWTPDQPEPRDTTDVALFKHRLIRLRLRTDLYSLQQQSQQHQQHAAAAAAAPPKPPLQPPTPPVALAPAFGLLPLSVKNISKASRPVLMYPRQLEAARERLPCGILVAYHPDLGLITDAVAEHYDVPALVAAHVGLPLSAVARIRGALRTKAAREAGRPLRHVTPLVAWDMVGELAARTATRREALSSGANSEVAAALKELHERSDRLREQVTARTAAAAQSATELEDGLLAWQVVNSGVLDDLQRSS